jgi:serine/threonine protein kinase
LDENNKKGPLHSISNRFEFAKQLARAVLYVHSTGYVHKSIRPETILLFEQENADSTKRYPRYLGRPYLLGFDQVRRDGPHSNRVSDGEWQKDIYRHPTRQGVDPQKVYNMRHDIYSLGVVFLEISLWNSFVLWDATHNVYTSSEHSCKLLEKGVTKTPERNFKSPKDIQSALLKTAERQVQLSMGDQFASIVIDCLTCVDGNLLGPWDDTEDEDEVDIGIRYIEGIIERLEALSV